MPYSEWKSTGVFQTVEGHLIFRREEGVGPGLLFLHGFPTCSYDWAPVVERLRDRFRCVTFDFLGFGASAKPPGRRYRYDEQTDVALAVARAARFERGVVVAHDYGVTVAQELLARGDPGFKHDACLFLNGGVFPAAHRPLLVQRLLAGPLGPALSPIVVNRATFGRSLSRVFGAQTKPTATELDDHWSAVIQNQGPRATSALLGYMAERRERAERWERALRETAVPLSFVWGLADPVSGAHMLDVVKQRLPRAETVPLENIGHYPQLEAPESVAAAIAAFAGRYAGRGT